MGTLVTVELPEDSPVLDMPWIITFGPLDEDEEWEPVVCGPYERPHALGLAEAVVADADLVAVVEPLLPHVSADEILGEIAAARLASSDSPASDPFDDDDDFDEDEDDGEEVEPVPAPSVGEVRAGFARIAARLGGAG